MNSLSIGHAPERRNQAPSPPPYPNPHPATDFIAFSQ